MDVPSNIFKIHNLIEIPRQYNITLQTKITLDLIYNRP